MPRQQSLAAADVACQAGVALTPRCTLHTFAPRCRHMNTFNDTSDSQGVANALAMRRPGGRLRVQPVINMDGTDCPGSVLAQLAQCMQQDMRIDATAVRNLYNGTRIEMCAEYARQRAYGKPRLSSLQTSRTALDEPCVWRPGSRRIPP